MHPTAARTLAPLLSVLVLAVAALAIPTPARAGEFAVSPIRADLKPGALSETLTVTNFADTPLRVSVKVMEWSQDETGQDAYKDTGDIVYFPRQLDIPAQGRRLIRIGAKAPATSVEKTYRAFIEEEPAPGTPAGAQVSFYFRFGVPVFLPPPDGRPQPEVARIEVAGSKVRVLVRNGGNQHFRLAKVQLASDAGFRGEASGWYSLAGSTRSYTFDLPAADCVKARQLRFTAEGEGVRLEQAVDVAPASCR